MKRTKRTIGCKLLTAEGCSLREEGRVQYRRGRWVTVPGNGVHVTITEGLFCDGSGPILAYLECQEPTGAAAPPGGICYRRVRWINPCPEQISPGLRGTIACNAPGLTRKERMELARASTPEWQGAIAACASDLTREDRMELARVSTEEWQGLIACNAPGLTREDRMELAWETNKYWRGLIACRVPDLTRADRMELAWASTAELRGRIAYCCQAPAITMKDRMSLAMSSTMYWRGRIACNAPGLIRKDRMFLAMGSSLYWRLQITRHTDLTRKERTTLLRGKRASEGAD